MITGLATDLQTIGATIDMLAERDKVNVCGMRVLKVGFSSDCELIALAQARHGYVIGVGFGFYWDSKADEYVPCWSNGHYDYTHDDAYDAYADMVIGSVWVDEEGN